MKKILSLLLLANLCLFADTIRVGMDAKYPPFEYLAGANEIKGFDVDFANELAKRVGFEIQIVNMGYDSICNAINENKIDIGISAFGNDEFTQNCDRSLSYFDGEFLLVKDKNRNDINSFRDLKDKKVIYDADNDVLRDFVMNFGAKPVPKKSGTFISSILLLHEGKADSIAMDSGNASLLKGNIDFLSNSDKASLSLIEGGLDNFVIFYRQPAKDQETFVIFPKDGRLETLKTQVNDVIYKMMNDGTIRKLLDKYGLDNYIDSSMK